VAASVPGGGAETGKSRSVMGSKMYGGESTAAESSGTTAGGLIKSPTIKNIVQEALFKRKSKAGLGWRESILIRNNRASMVGLPNSASAAAVAAAASAAAAFASASKLGGDKGLGSKEDGETQVIASVSSGLTLNETKRTEPKSPTKSPSLPLSSNLSIATTTATSAATTTTSLQSLQQQPQPQPSSPKPATTRAPPTPIKNWTQGRMIGQGAFGKVFHALNMDTGEFLAVKQVLLGPESDLNKKKREEALKRELELLKELDHINIVRYLGMIVVLSHLI
jgi:hypothetical protein